MPSFRILLVAGATLVFAATAVAQTPGQRIITGPSGSSPRQETLVRVQTSINFFIPDPTGEDKEAQKLREKARRIVYEMAVHECDLLREVLAKDCWMETVNNNISQQQQEGYNVNGSVSFHISLK
ncbi:MAG TPA: hypothetical protein VFK01_06660 [Bradyrhizobium sp.]|nr:hypothetical protein [Bradyrhizobium sp.]